MANHIAKNTQKGFIAFLVSGFILACFGLLARLLNQYLGNYIQVSIRMVFAMIIVLSYIIYKKIPMKVKVTNLPLFVVFILSFPVYIILFTVSVNTTKVANAFFYLFLSSMLTPYVIGYLHFKETLDFQKILVASLLIASLFLFANLSDLGEDLTGIVTGLLGGVFWGVSNATRKLYADKYSRWLVILYQMLFGAILAFLLSLLTSELQDSVWELPTYILVLIYSLFMVIFQILLFVGFQNFNLNLGSIVLASQLIFVQILGMFLLNEFPTTCELIGMLFVLIAIILSSLKHPLTQSKTNVNK